MSQQVSDVLRDVCGQLCWGVEWDSQLNLSMSFGDPHLRIREPVRNEQPDAPVGLLAYRMVKSRGRWWLWIFCAYWKLTLPDIAPVTGATPEHRIRRALARLNGQRLTAVEVKLKTSATRFTFDLGAILVVCRIGPAEDGDMWTLHMRDQRTLSVRRNLSRWM
jgi:hypothetical protein